MILYTQSENVPLLPFGGALPRPRMLLAEHGCYGLREGMPERQMTSHRLVLVAGRPSLDASLGWFEAYLTVLVPF